MILLTFFYLLSTFAVAESACTRKAPRREGFLRHTCVPGFYEGSCLIILKKLPFHNARESCRYDYGGRLATAPTKEALQIWRRTIHFDAKITLNKDTRFWVGYGMNLSSATYDLVFKYDEPDKKMQKFINLTMWTRVFGKPTTSANIKWEEYLDKIRLDPYTCPRFTVIFNPNNMKFDVASSDDLNYALCETPRWAKLQCDEGWHLVPQLRMCLKVHYDFSDFKTAHDKCRVEKSFISVAQDFVELEMFRAVIGPYGIPPIGFQLIFNSSLIIPSFWAGTKSLNHISFSLDGTKVVFGSEGASNLCLVHTFENFIGWDGRPRNSISPECEGYYLPYMCQRFADQSLLKNV